MDILLIGQRISESPVFQLSISVVSEDSDKEDSVTEETHKIGDQYVWQRN